MGDLLEHKRGYDGCTQTKAHIEVRLLLEGHVYQGNWAT